MLHLYIYTSSALCHQWACISAEKLALKGILDFIFENLLQKCQEASEALVDLAKPSLALPDHKIKAEPLKLDL